MELLKPGATNVRAVDDILTTRYAVYTPVDAASNPQPDDTSAVIAELRRRNILCAVVKDELWTFRPPPDEQPALDLTAYGYGVKSGTGNEGALDEHAQQRAADGRRVRDLFLEALGGSISYELAQQHFLRIGAWAWLFCPPRDTGRWFDGTNVLVRLHVRISHAGVLYISTTTSARALSRAYDTPDVADVHAILAPSGRPAALVKDRARVSAARHAPGSEAWRAKVSRLLVAGGIEIAPRDPWVLVELLAPDGPKELLWPLDLCVTTAFAAEFRLTLSFDSADWRQFFDISDRTFCDAITSAEMCVLRAREHEGSASDGDLVGPLPAGHSNKGPSVAEAENGRTVSPPFSQRAADRQGAASGIYPTPPDGLVNASVTQRPTSDGTVVPAASRQQSLPDAEAPQGGDDAQNRQTDGRDAEEGPNLGDDAQARLEDHEPDTDMARGDEDSTTRQSDAPDAEMPDGGDDSPTQRSREPDTEMVNDGEDAPTRQADRPDVKMPDGADDAQTQEAREPSPPVPRGPAAPPPSSNDFCSDSAEIEYGAAEVGDADFDYFDEPDARLGDMTTTAGKRKTRILEHEPAAMIEAEYNMLNEDLAMSEDDVEMPYDPPNYPPESEMPSEPPNLPLESELDSAPLTMHHESWLSVSNTPENEVKLVFDRFFPPTGAPTVDESQPSSDNHSRLLFRPLSFHDEVDLRFKYGAHAEIPFDVQNTHQPGPQIGLPPSRKPFWQLTSSTWEPDLADERNESISDDAAPVVAEIDTDTNDNATDLRDESPPEPVGDLRKRKRSAEEHGTADNLQQGSNTRDKEQAAENDGASEKTADDPLSLLLLPTGRGDFMDTPSRTTDKATKRCIQRLARASTRPALRLDAEELPSVEDVFPDLAGVDLVYIAQLVSEHAVSAVPVLRGEQEVHVNVPDDDPPAPWTTQRRVELVLQKMFPRASCCDAAQLALIRRPARMTRGNPKAPHPRSAPRSDDQPCHPDHFSLPPPFIRVQRAIASRMETWEMLPTALSFWTALGLGPAGGPKDVFAIGIGPSNSELQCMARDFLYELGTAYESYKLGAWGDLSGFVALEKLPTFEDGVVSVALEDDTTIGAAVRAYATACAELGAALAAVGDSDPDHTFVVFMINPFKGERAEHHLCACFWKLYRAYLEHEPAAAKELPRSDIVLQILPVDLFASTNTLPMLDLRQMGALALEVYDRCPPSPSAPAGGEPGALPIIAAPAVELASLPPRGITFHQTIDPPRDLLFEGSVLHVAYALSRDGEWMTLCWTDATGRYQRTAASCLRGKPFADVAEDVWARTLEILAAREIMWRVFITTTAAPGPAMQKRWRAVVSAHARPRMLHVTLLSVQMEPEVQYRHTPIFRHAARSSWPPPPRSHTPTTTTTPQSTAAVASPDVGGGGGGGTPTAAATPGSGEVAVIATPEPDPDVRLVDLTDESRGLLLSASFHSAPYPTATSSANDRCPRLAAAVLFQRADLHTRGPRGRRAGVPEALGVRLHWDIRVRPGGAVDEGSRRQAEATLRDVVASFRDLSVLGRARGLRWPDGKSRAAPVHLVAAARAAEALEGFLK